MQKIKVVILAAGKGKRMGSDKQKALMEICGKPMIGHLLDAIEESGIGTRPIVVYGHGGQELVEYVKDRADVVLQAEQLGTGHAVAVTREVVGEADLLLVLYGDSCLVSAETIKKIVAYYESRPAPIIMGVGTVESFEGWQESFKGFGRILRDEHEMITAIREAKDATPEELAVKEVNPAYYVFETKWLWDHIDKIGTENVQGEVYLTDLIKMAVDQGEPVRTYPIPIEECVGCNRPEELEIAEELMKKRNTCAS
ncbi:MAG: NTP transferase domain-containing protein [Candidatus Uhrbacteria bacterium]|nr:NTP transferase domain-containing protein [Patescibacteria group bacterium]MBU1906549.1 NTP transferase domain-containing protein [Patescibacteria group bacterium]